MEKQLLPEVPSHLERRERSDDYVPERDAYYPPSQAAWRPGNVLGYAAYKVADSVVTHEGWGLGSYCFFNVDPTIHAAHGFEVPDTQGVKLHDLLTVSFNFDGIIDHVVNDTGAATGPNTMPVDLVSYP